MNIDMEEARKALTSHDVRSPQQMFRNINDYLDNRDIRPVPWRGVGSYFVRLSPSAVALKYQKINIVTLFHDGRIILDSGGWSTWQVETFGQPAKRPSITTKRRMNELLERVGCWIYQTKYSWFVSTGGKLEPQPFVDGMMMSPTSSGKWAVVS
jgi:hypothetical protein